MPQNINKKGVPPTFRKFCTLSKFQHKYGQTPVCWGSWPYLCRLILFKGPNKLSGKLFK